MEYLIVRTSPKKGGVVSVLVNGEKNGYVDKTIILDEGFVEISVDLPGAETVEIDLIDTIPSKPKEVIINVE